MNIMAGSFAIRQSKTIWRDPVKRIGAIMRMTFTAGPRLIVARMNFAI
jgi:hypothetical protein